MEQLIFDLRTLAVVPNCWGPVYHLQFLEDGYTFLPGEQPVFRSISAAVEWARARGREAVVPEEARLRWAHITPAEMADYLEAARRAGTRIS